MTQQHSTRRRSAIKALAAFTLVPVCRAGAAGAAAGAAASYPDHLVKMINPWTPGGPGDTLGRPVAEALGQLWNQPVIVENRPGANAVLGTAYAAKQPPDGYTILLAQTGPNCIAPAFGQGTPYDPIEDFSFITQITDAALALAVRADLPIHSIGELITYAQANPKKLSYGSVGYGSTTQIAAETLKSMGHFDWLHVPYKGAVPVITDMLGGQISAAFLNIAGLMPYAGGDKIRIIAVTSKKRSKFLPDVPAIAETLPGFEQTSWYGLMAPARTPPAIIDKIYQTAVKGLHTPQAEKIYASQAQDLVLTPPDAFRQAVREQCAMYARLIKQLNITEG
jgi:tripartite-type tricarboxylate transporter receptor subunit TctC